MGSIANNLTTTVEGYALDARQGYALDQKKLDVAKVANNLVTTDEGWALDARQGKYLSDTKVGFTDIADNLTTDSNSKPLSARQGKALDEKKVNTADIVNNLTSGGTAKVLSAEQGKTLKTQIDNQAFKATATLSASGWSGSGPYTQKVTVSGVASGDEPTVDVNLASASTEAAIEELEEAWAMVKKGSTASGAITFTALEKPTINIPIKVKGR